MPNASVAKCSFRFGSDGATGVDPEPAREWDSVLYAKQVVPFVDLTVKGWTWYQGDCTAIPPAALPGFTQTGDATLLSIRFHLNVGEVVRDRRTVVVATARVLDRESQQTAVPLTATLQSLRSFLAGFLWGGGGVLLRAE